MPISECKFNNDEIREFYPIPIDLKDKTLHKTLMFKKRMENKNHNMRLNNGCN